ncbi:MAG: YwbE family protein [Adhaeribacter sp.]
MSGQNRKDIYPGLPVAIILKKDQRSGQLTYGIVKDILTSAPFHSRGIKVRLQDGQIGRVAEIEPEETN